MLTDGGDGEPGRERALIERIRRRLASAPAWVRVGIGDDAAVLEPERNRLDVLTTDTLVEGVHWDSRFCSPGDVGHKSLAVNLSDIAAMGATPRAALLSMAIPSHLTDDTAGFIDPFIDALAGAAAEARVAIVGGNLTSTPGPLAITVTLTGSVHPRRILTRAGGSPGDHLYVTGTIGTAAAGLLWLKEHPMASEPDDPSLTICVRQYRRPAARVRAGELVGRNRAAAACMDLSDGFADAVRQVAEASGTGARVEGEALPIEPGAAAEFRRHQLEPLRAAVGGGDDYELLFAVSPRQRRAFEGLRGSLRGLALTRVGELTQGPDLVLRATSGGPDEPLPAGYSHF
jgi:thiamine-monophosphate kinase